ncbi:hypothetical protein D3C86_1971180 [compost metagenome]
MPNGRSNCGCPTSDSAATAPSRDIPVKRLSPVTTSTWLHCPLATRAAACITMMQALAPPACMAKQAPG